MWLRFHREIARHSSHCCLKEVCPHDIANVENAYILVNRNDRIIHKKILLHESPISHKCLDYNQTKVANQHEGKEIWLPTVKLRSPKEDHLSHICMMRIDLYTLLSMYRMRIMFITHDESERTKIIHLI